ncbi:MAG: DUF4402 domain-containing protein [Myxococcota bacterium]
MTLVLAMGFTPMASAIDFTHDGVVDVFAALAVAETTELDFGIVSDNDGTVTLNTSDTISSDPSGIHAGGTVATGDYTITGEASTTVAVTLTGSTAAGLTIGTFTTDQADLNNVPLGVGGSVVLAIGADLTVSAASASPGTNQTLSFTLGITYN